MRAATPAGRGPIRLCFVCLGNICRSPAAMAVMAAHVAEAGLTGCIEVDSAGTGSWHLGDVPDRRTRAEAARRGIPLDHYGKQFASGDFARYDLVLAMDRANQSDLRALAPDSTARAKIRLLRSFDPAADGALEIPDPYYGGPDDFAEVFDLVDAACRGLLDALRRDCRE
ncbi:MAG: low molecular weight protein-tyrosine-phosphatase [Acidimicrobiia bacterium]